MAWPFIIDLQPSRQKPRGSQAAVGRAIVVAQSPSREASLPPAPAGAPQQGRLFGLGYSSPGCVLVKGIIHHEENQPLVVLATPA